MNDLKHSVLTRPSSSSAVCPLLTSLKVYNYNSLFSARYNRNGWLGVKHQVSLSLSYIRERLKTSPRDFKKNKKILNRIEELPLIIPNFRPELWTRPSSLTIGHDILRFSPVIKRCNFRFDLGFPGLLRHLCINWERRRLPALILRKQRLWRR